MTEQLLLVAQKTELEGEGSNGNKKELRLSVRKFVDWRGSE